MKKKIISFLVVLSFAIIVTYPSFPPSHALDSYCTMYNGYTKTGIWFLQNGRIFSYLLFNVANALNISYNSLGFVSVFIGNIFISLTIIILYNKLKTKMNYNNYLYDYLLLGLVFLIYINPLYISILVFDEVMIMDLGILFLTLASIKILNKGLRNYLLALLLTILGITCYQGFASYLFVVLLVLIVADKERFNNIKYFIIKFLLTIVNYGISFVINLLFINSFNKITNKSNVKVGAFNIFDNINITITKLMPSSFKYLFNYVNVKIYYLLVIITIIVLIIFILKNKNKTNNIVLIIIILLSCLVVPFIPNIFMASTSNYTDARMTLTLGIIPAILLLFILLAFKVEKKSFYIISCLCAIIFLLTFYSIRQNALIDLKRYKYDYKYLNTIISEIDIYETENKRTIDTIYYHYDNDSAYYYNFGYPNGVNIRLMAVPWAFDCAFNAIKSNNYDIKKMSEDKYNKLFANKEYDTFSKQQLVFEGKKLYLLIY